MNLIRCNRQLTWLLLFFALNAVLLPAQDRVSEEEVNTQKIFIDASKEKILGNYDSAIRLFQEVLKRDRKNHAAAYELARIYDAREDINKALESIRKAIKLSPDNEWYQLFLADTYEKNSEPRAAAEIFGQLVDRFPGNPFYYERWAFSLVKGRQSEAAIAVYDRMETQFGVSEDISRRKHQLYLGMGEQAKAAAELERLISSSPSNTQYYHMLASFYQQVGKSNDAETVYERLLAVDSTDVRASIALAGKQKGAAAGDTGFLETLKPVFEKADVNIDLKIKELIPYIHKVADGNDPSIVAPTLELASILERVHPKEAKAYSAHADLLYYSGQVPEALEKYQKALELNKSVFSIWEQIMYIHTEMADFEALNTISEAAIDRFPNRAKAYYFNGIAQGQLAKHGDAVASFRQALMMSRKDPVLQVDIYNHLGTEYFMQKKYDQSFGSFERALGINPQAHNVMNRYAYYLAVRGESLPKAKEMAAVSNELAPNLASYQDTYGWVLYKMKEYKAAKEWIAKALANGGDRSSAILEHFGDVLYQLGDTETAQSYWQQALEVGNDGSEFLEKKVAEGKLFE